MKTSKYGYQMILILTAGVLALFAPIVLKTKSLSFIIAPHALLIVLFGTLCAICISYSPKELFGALISLKSLFVSRESNLSRCAQEIIEIAKITRAKGFLVLEEISQQIENPFLKNALEYLHEDCDTRTLEENLKIMCFYENKEDFKNIEIFEEMGGYAPTFGIIGAVMGLIQISASSSDSKSLLGGIATAFIATVYGVASANMFFLPVAKKLKNSLEIKLSEQEIIISSVIDIANRQSSIIINEKLNRFLHANNFKGTNKVIPFAA